MSMTTLQVNGRKQLGEFTVKVSIIVGSHRQESQSSKVGAAIGKILGARGAKCYTFDLRGNPIPLWDESVWDKDPHWEKLWQPISAELASSYAFVVISPEWSGMVPAGLKNFFLLCSTELSHKPGLIVSVSAGTGGTYPVAELRMSSYKNTRLCYIPEHVIVRNVGSVLESDKDTDLSPEDSYIRTRLDYALSLLLEYGRAMAPIRESDVVLQRPKAAQHGM
jgi:multimeric flavodoxin WrbA